MTKTRHVYVSMIRGINVGGHKRLKMDALRELYGTLDLEHAATYVQSGNVSFLSSVEDAGQIEANIEQAIDQSFGYSVSVMVRTPAELDVIISENPFPAECEEDPSRTFVLFLGGQPNIDVAGLAAPKGAPERFVAGTRAIYLHCPNGAGNSKVPGNFFEKGLGVRTTARNWRTVLALRALASKTAKAEGEG